MRPLRLLGEGRSFYHCISRVVDRQMVFEPEDKEVFRKIMRNLEAFMGGSFKGQTSNNYFKYFIFKGQTSNCFRPCLNRLDPPCCLA